MHRLHRLPAYLLGSMTNSSRSIVVPRILCKSHDFGQEITSSQEEVAVCRRGRRFHAQYTDPPRGPSAVPASALVEVR
jgi:hypothetical protein